HWPPSPTVRTGAGRLAGRVAVITGGTSGIGAATARLFAGEGATVVIAGRTSEKGEAVAAELGGNASFRWTDVRHEDSIAALVDHAVDRHGRLDCLFNNAGAPGSGALDSVTADEF